MHEQSSYRATVLLHHYVEQSGRSRAEFARAFEITPDVFASIVSGTTLATEPLARAIAKAVGMPCGAVFVRQRPPATLKRVATVSGIGILVTTLVLAVIGAALYFTLRSDPKVLMRSMNAGSAITTPIIRYPTAAPDARARSVYPVLHGHRATQPKGGAHLVMPRL